MLYHIRSALVLDSRSTVACEIDLVGITCEELGLDLLGGDDLDVRRPCPNKNWHVACRRIGRKAVEGFLVETEAPVLSFAVEVIWRIDGEACPHLVRYDVTDTEFDAVTTSSTHWYGFERQGRRFEPRRPHPPEEGPPVERDAYLKVRTSQSGVYVDHRRGEMRLPTVERARLLHPARQRNDRLPQFRDAFRIGSAQDVA